MIGDASDEDDGNDSGSEYGASKKKSSSSRRGRGRGRERGRVRRSTRTCKPDIKFYGYVNQSLREDDCAVEMLL